MNNETCDNIISLAFTGDLSPWGVKVAPPEVIEKSFQHISNLVSPFDLSICNLECVVSSYHEEELMLSISETDCPPLTNLGFDIFCLANNHTKDAGAQALVEMQQAIEESGALTVGAGYNVNCANSPLILTLKNKRIGILNVTDASHYGASSKEAGVSVLNSRQIVESSKNLAAKVDIVITIIHADLEFSNYPAPWRVRLSRKLARYCDVIVHHHPHTLQGIEEVDNCVIAYSLGNFIFPIQESSYMHNRIGNVDEGMLLNIDINFTGDEKVKRISIIPTLIGEYGFLNTLPEEHSKIIKSKIQTYSLILKDNNKLRRMHFKRCIHEFKNLIMSVYYRLRRGKPKEAFAYFLWHFRTDQHRNWLKGFVSFGYL